MAQEEAQSGVEIVDAGSSGGNALAPVAVGAPDAGSSDGGRARRPKR
jgi:hypothetical protein